MGQWTGTWNVGSFTGKYRELAAVLKRVNVGFVQETRWNESNAMAMRERYKLNVRNTDCKTDESIILDRASGMGW